MESKSIKKERSRKSRRKEGKRRGRKRGKRRERRRREEINQKKVNVNVCFLYIGISKIQENRL
jgi:hypothetical protein